MSVAVLLAEQVLPLELPGRRLRGRGRGAEREVHEDEGGRALRHDGRGAAALARLVAAAPHAAVVVVAGRVRVAGLAVVALAAAARRGIIFKNESLTDFKDISSLACLSTLKYGVNLSTDVKYASSPQHTTTPKVAKYCKTGSTIV